MVIMITLTPDGRAWEVASEQADDENGARVYSGMALDAPEQWDRNHYILTMTMLDTSKATDKPHNMATTIYRNMKSGAYMPDGTIYGTVYITNETANALRTLFVIAL